MTDSQDYICPSGNDRLTNFAIVEADILETLSNVDTSESNVKKKFEPLLTNPPSFDSKTEADFTISANMSGINSLQVKQFPGKLNFFY